MDKLARILSAAAAALLVMSCSEEENRRPEPGRDTFRENPDWTLTYKGREVDSGDGVYVVDPVYVSSSDDIPYYVDVVSLSDYNSVYGASIAALIKGRSSDMDKSYIFTGDSRTAFDALDAGDGEWVAIAFEVDASGKPGSLYSFLQFRTKAVSMKEDDSFTLSYDGRKKWTDNGKETDDDVDVISVKTSSPYSYYVDIAYPEYISSNYDGDPVKFFNAVLDDIAAGLEENEDFSGIVCRGDTSISFDRLRHGDWTAYAFGVDYLGNLTGSWSKVDFDIKEEAATEAFSKWLGTWRIGGTGYGESTAPIYYDISIESSENNMYYAVRPVKFFNAVLDDIAAGLEENEDFSGIVCRGDTSISFDRLRHGDWTAYAFGVDYLGNLTGSWSKVDFDIKEEAATEAFSKWLGTWRIGGTGYGESTAPIYYDISIESSENNMYYAVRNWETGRYADAYANENAKDYVFETVFDKAGGDMLFTSQYLGSMEDSEIGSFDVCLLGNVDKNGTTYTVTDTGLTIASAAMAEDGQSASVKPARVTVNLNGNYTSDFVSMQFTDLTSDGKVFIYNKSVPSLPMTMTRLGNSTAEAPAAKPARTLPVRRNAAGSATRPGGHWKASSARRSLENIDNLRVTSSASVSSTKSSTKTSTRKEVIKNSFQRRK